jgi:hypothetical protein
MIRVKTPSSMVEVLALLAEIILSLTKGVAFRFWAWTGAGHTSGVGFHARQYSVVKYRAGGAKDGTAPKPRPPCAAECSIDFEDDWTVERIGGPDRTDRGGFSQSELSPRPLESITFGFVPKYF